MTTEVPSELNLLWVRGAFDPAAEVTEFRLDDGRALRVPTSVLVNAHHVVPGPLSTGPGHPAEAGNSEGISIPIVEEKLSVGKRVVPTGTVRLQKTVQEFQTALNEPLAVRTFDVERVILNHPVEEVPVIRQDGETTIYPVVEEQLVLTKQLLLREEIRVTRRDTERIDTQTVTLRREHVEIEREPAS